MKMGCIITVTGTKKGSVSLISLIPLLRNMPSNTQGITLYLNKDKKSKKLKSDACFEFVV